MLSLCLTLEEGEFSVKARTKPKVSIEEEEQDHDANGKEKEKETPEESVINEREIKSVKVKGLSDMVVFEWIKSIYNGDTSKIKANTEWQEWCEKFGEEISNSITFNLRLSSKPFTKRGLFSDITFRIPKKSGDTEIRDDDDEGMVFYAHKILFQSHSEYFDALFKNLMDFAHFHTQSPLPDIDKDHVMEIPLYSMDSDEFEVLRNFIYGLHVSAEAGDDILVTLVLANKHIMGLLESVCENFIFLNFEKFNPIEILNLSRNINKEELFLYTKWYMKMHYKKLKVDLDTGEVDDEITQEIVAGQWPGPAYEEAYQQWREKFVAEKEKMDSLCCVQ